MNIQHMKYAVVVAETNSINKAAEKLYVGQPNLSRAIKELEASLGIAIFERKAKGMFLTPDGEIFIRYAKNILKQIEEVEDLFDKSIYKKQHFSISVPRASYISEAFAELSNGLDAKDNAELIYSETDTMTALKNVSQENYKLAIIRYAEGYDKYYKSVMNSKGLSYELVNEFEYVLLLNKNCPLANEKTISADKLRNYIQITHADPFVPFLPFSETRKEEKTENTSRKIFVLERASQFEILSKNIDAFMWVSPIPQSLLNRYGLIQRRCVNSAKKYKDMLVHKKEYSLSKLDTMFVEKLVKSKRTTMNLDIT